jgi:DNA polymerase-1
MGITEEEYHALPKEKKSSIRSTAKASNFGLIFGQEPEGFKEYAKTNYGVELTLKEATHIRNEFFVMYPAITKYHEEYKAKGRKYGYVRTIFGRRRLLPNIKHAESYIRAEDERYAINSPVQGSNGDNCIYALALLDYRLPESVHLVNTVHDSILLYCPKDLVNYVAKIAKKTCENLPSLAFFGREMTKLKMKVDLEISETSWADLREYVESEW